MSWEMMKLGEVADVVRGVTFSKSETTNTPLDDNYLPVIRAGNIQQGRLLLNDNLVYVYSSKIRKIQLIQKGDIIMCTSSGSASIVGKCAIAKSGWHGSYGAFNAGIRSKGLIVSSFLFYCLSSPIFKSWSVKSAGANIKNIRNSELKDFPIPLPPLETQKRIVELLDRAQSLIDKRKEQIALMDKLIQSIFYDMFGDPVLNPMGWELEKLGAVGRLERGKSKHRPRNAPELLGGKYPLIQTGDIANAGFYVKEYFHTYSELGLAQSKIWKKGTLCITIAANIAKTSILGFDACFPDSVVAFLPYKKIEIMYVQLWFGFLQKIIEANAPESAQKNINLKILNDLDIPVPPIILQKTFADRVQKIEAQKAAMTTSLRELEDNFNSLMQRAFKVELINL